jgi:nitronate monooxygenase
MTIRTRLTERLNIEHPILNAPMGGAAGGRLAAAVTAAGGLGLIGGGMADPDWLTHEFAEAGNARVGCGFITWSLAGQPATLDIALAHAPVAVMLSFGDPSPFAPAIKAAARLLICQVQDMRHAEAALDVGADIVVAQGTEAGGHGARRATMTLVPEVADLLARRSPDTLLVAAGGIADGRGLAAALMLGADGVLVGSRLWASPEALVHPNLQRAALAGNGDATLRQSAGDVARGAAWPAEFSGRVLRNSFTDRWAGKEEELRLVAEELRPAYIQAVADADADKVAVYVGEVIGIMDKLVPAGESIRAMAAQAEALLSGRAAVMAR